ncbi:putative glutamate receptor [Trichonephila inaurata madagascariensis]|uniref:Putative glutamate receptor n=1 Tax=Trichonephila inaurata madagascariensis TaxID=2747483 RepID=A0A8X7C1S0_9ARAC|nr:putative glutamate receptor [Trichonephila inaurata madagascariensis]
MNIEYDIVFPLDNEYGREITAGNWTGIVGMVHRGEADLAINTLGINENRFKVIDFSFPYSSSRLTFASLKPYEWSRTFGLLDLFDLPTWMLLFFSILLSSATFFVVLKGTASYFEVFYNLLGSILRQPLMLPNYTLEKKFLTGSWLMFSCIMSSVFCSVLLSFLATPAKVAPIKNFRELSKAVERGTHRAYSVIGAAAIPFFLNSKEPYLRLLGRLLEKNKWYITPGQTLNTQVKSEESVIISVSEYLMFMYRVEDFQSRILISEENGYTVPTAFAIRKDFCCTSQLRKVMSRMVSAGIYDRCSKLEILKHRLSQMVNEEKVNEEHILSLEDLLGPFSVLLTGWVVSLLVFLGEIIFSSCARRNILKCTGKKNMSMT